MAATKKEEVTPKKMPQKLTEEPPSSVEFHVGSEENTSSWSTPNQKPNMITPQQIRALKNADVVKLGKIKASIKPIPQNIEWISSLSDVLLPRMRYVRRTLKTVARDLPT